MDTTDKGRIDETLLAGISPEGQVRARKMLAEGFSVFNSANEAPWINPDGSNTYDPKAPMIADPEE